MAVLAKVYVIVSILVRMHPTTLANISYFSNLLRTRITTITKIGMPRINNFRVNWLNVISKIFDCQFFPLARQKNRVFLVFVVMPFQVSSCFNALSAAELCALLPPQPIEGVLQRLRALPAFDSLSVGNRHVVDSVNLQFNVWVVAEEGLHCFQCLLIVLNDCSICSSFYRQCSFNTFDSSLEFKTNQIYRHKKLLQSFLGIVELLFLQHLFKRVSRNSAFGLQMSFLLFLLLNQLIDSLLELKIFYLSKIIQFSEFVNQNYWWESQQLLNVSLQFFIFQLPNKQMNEIEIMVILNVSFNGFIIILYIHSNYPHSLFPMIVFQKHLLKSRQSKSGIVSLAAPRENTQNFARLMRKFRLLPFQNVFKFPIVFENVSNLMLSFNTNRVFTLKDWIILKFCQFSLFYLK